MNCPEPSCPEFRLQGCSTQQNTEQSILGVQTLNPKPKTLNLSFEVILETSLPRDLKAKCKAGRKQPGKPQGLYTRTLLSGILG